MLSTAAPRLSRLEDRVNPVLTIALVDGTIYVTGTDQADTIYVAVANESVQQVVVSDDLSFQDAAFFVETREVRSINIDGLGGDDTIDLSRLTLALPSLITGRGGNDVLIGGAGDDVIKGGAGNDQILGRGGNDDLRGAGGDDVIKGGAGNDFIVGGIGNDMLRAGAGTDTLSGKAGDDTLRGGRDNDTLDGGEGTDDLDGGVGQNSLFQ